MPAPETEKNIRAVSNGASDRPATESPFSFIYLDYLTVVKTIQKKLSGRYHSQKHAGPGANKINEINKHVISECSKDHDKAKICEQISCAGNAPSL